MSSIRTRFAPSPTGYLHVGGLRTALYAYLFAKKQGGQFLLRIEDTDRERFVDGAVKNIVESLRWAGMTIDEGVDIDDHGQVIQKGDHGPYIQSERLSVYKEQINVLLEKGSAYYCFCSKERLDELRKTQEAMKQPTMYDGHCRSLPLSEAEERLKNGETAVVRMMMPKEGETVFTDLIRGEVRF
ncbi:MAG TPA: glutamate--tRNA ligase family protein, partial [Candidatus Kapabacteria bacterium]|nr:glutamate--tRNA ligase family protein [Candidatus Kapabacteria bacterium]